MTATASRWRREPFRVFFPLGVVLGWIGIGHWLLYTTGITASYSCLAHGLVQMQGFMVAFATGFLLTAIPTRTRAAPPGAAAVWTIAIALVVVTAAAIDERWVAAELAYVLVFAVLLGFALRRFRAGGAGRRPPAPFVLIPLGVLCGVAGSAAIALWASRLAGPLALVMGRLLVEQGVFLCFVLGVSGLILPIMAGAPPPPDLGASPRETRRAAAYAAAGAVVVASLVAEAAGSIRAAPLARAIVVGSTLWLAGGGLPIGPGLNRRLVRLALWCGPIGLTAAALWPDYRIPALHVLFIGGFSWLAFGVATHVCLGHLGAEALRDGWPRPIVAVAAGLVLAMMGRVAADMSQSYFDHLGWAAAAWLLGSVVWLAYLGPRLLRP